MSKQGVVKAETAKRAQTSTLKARRRQPARVNDTAVHTPALKGAALIQHSANLGNGLYVIQFLQAGASSGNDTGPQLAPRQLQRLPKMNHAQMAEAIARLEQQSAVRTARRTTRGKAAPSVAELPAPKENTEFLAQLKKSELERRSQLEDSGNLVDSQALADLMGVTRQAITKAEAEMRMFSLDGAAGKKLYPVFFADAAIDRRAIQKVSKALDRLAGSSKWQFFTNPRLSLGRKTPIEALRKGKVDQVLAAAIAFREA